MTTKIISEFKLDEIYGINKNYIKNEKEYYVLYRPELEGFTYDIKKFRCNSSEKLLNWILHLSEKRWITPKHISCLVACFMDDNNIDQKLL